VDTYFGNYAD